jgi:hypothetical protein
MKRAFPAWKLFLTLTLLLPSIAPADPIDPILGQTVSAIDNWDFSKLRGTLNAQGALAVADLQNLDSPRIISVASCRQFVRFFSSISTPTHEQREALAWLVEQPHLMPVLMSAVSPKDSPRRVLQLVTLLRSTAPDKLDQWPDLTTALIVVWDKSLPPDGTGYRPKFTPDRPAQLFSYFTDPQTPLRFNLRQLAWQLQLFIVDLRVSEDEMHWATQRYLNNYSIASAYFDLTYDDNAFLNGDPKKISGHDYTLQNLLQYGGVCVEQAYYASEVAKSLGIPACMCSNSGGGAGGVGHAWLGFVENPNHFFAWNFDQGRYTDDLFWSANITDPQTREILTDADVGLLAGLQQTDNDTRLLSADLLKLIDLVPPEHRFDTALREIEVCPGNRPAWLFLAAMDAQGSLSPAQIQLLGSAIDQYLLKHYPDFALQIMMRAVSNQPPAAQVDSLDRICRLFPDRPDLRARVRLTQADLLVTLHQDDAAFRALSDILANDMNAGAIILEAMTRIDKLMRAHDNLPGLARLYAQTWPRMPAPDRSSYVYSTPYFVVGKIYLTLLEDLGDEADAQNVRNRLTQLIPDGAPLR